MVFVRVLTTFFVVYAVLLAVLAAITSSALSYLARDLAFLPDEIGLFVNVVSFLIAADISVRRGLTGRLDSKVSPFVKERSLKQGRGVLIGLFAFIAAGIDRFAFLLAQSRAGEQLSHMPNGRHLVLLICYSALAWLFFSLQDSRKRTP